VDLSIVFCGRNKAIIATMLKGLASRVSRRHHGDTETAPPAYHEGIFERLGPELRVKWLGQNGWVKSIT
jgi:hypothetical protein